MNSTAIEHSSSEANGPKGNQLKNIKHIVMVASGKGGVGKSTTCVNLALAMAATGLRVGIMDADIYGPSQQTMLGVSTGEKPEIVNDHFMQPLTCHGIKSMSIGYLAADKAPMIWRGPMATKALQQMFEQTLWGELDYLFIDMPPGTGDIHISLAQKLTLAGAIIVTTPQEVALTDARKGIEMFRKVNIPLLGIVENMATHQCANCGHEEHIFGQGGAKLLEDQYQVSVLASLPLNPKIGSDLDKGMPSLICEPDGVIAREYLSLASQVAARIHRQAEANKVESTTTIRIIE